MSSIYDFNALISAVDVDFRDIIKPSGLLRHMQEAGNAHFREMGGGYEKLTGANMAFILTRVVMTLPGNIRYFDTVHIRTWHQGHKGPYFTRNYEFLVNHQISGRATTLWVLLDTAQKRVLRPSALPFDIPSLPERGSGLDISRIEFPADMPKTGGRPVYYSDIDHYQHMNNTVYADICCDFLPGGVKGLEGRRVARFDITYHAEAAAGDTLDIFAVERAGSAYVRGMRGDKKSFEARMEFDGV